MKVWFSISLYLSVLFILNSLLLLLAVARLGLYQLALSSPEFLPLLRFAIRAETITDSCVLILMDWTRPWKFLETLERWINVLHHLIDEICKEGIAAETTWSKGKAIVDELREKCNINPYPPFFYYPKN